MKERSYVMVKPEFANSKFVIEEVRRRLESAGLKIEQADYINYDADHAKQHYAEHVGKGFYPELEAYITSDKAYGMIVVGENAIATIRGLVGSTKNPVKGTIRYDIPVIMNLPLRVTENVVHASDSVDSAKREIAIFEDLVDTATKSF